MNHTTKRGVYMRLLASLVLFTICAALAVPALTRQDETEADVSRQPQVPEPARAHCHCWHCAATSPNA